MFWCLFILSTQQFSDPHTHTKKCVCGSDLWTRSLPSVAMCTPGVAYVKIACFVVSFFCGLSINKQMKHLALILLIILIVLQVYSTMSHETYQQQKCPSGSYQNSCKNIICDKTIDKIAAYCHMGGGSWKNTILCNYSKCNPGSISNDRGNLVCTGPSTTRNLDC